jgi:hypothetical protein
MAFKENELVLVRRPETKAGDMKWKAASYERTMESNGRKKHLCTGTWWLECIPYKLNEELLGTEDEPKDIDSLKWGDRCLAWHVVDGWRECIFHSLIKEMNYPWQVILKPNPKEGKSGNVEMYSSSMLKIVK